VSGGDGTLGEIRRALAGITRRLDVLADAVGVAAAAQPGALLDEPTRARLSALQSLLAVGQAATPHEAGLLAVDRAITHARADCAALVQWGIEGAPPTIAQRGWRLPLDPRADAGILGRSLQTGEVVQAAPGLGASDDLLDAHGIAAALAVPILDPAGKPGGVLLAGRRRAVPFEPDAVAALILVSDRVAGVLHPTTAPAPAAPPPSRSRDAGAPATLFASLDMTRTARAVAAEARARLGADAVAVLVPDGAAYLLAGGAGLPDSAPSEGQVLPFGPLGSSGRTSAPEGGALEDRELARCLGTSALAVLPLTTDDGLVAFLAIGGPVSGDSALSSAFRRDAALALRNARLHDESLRALAEARPPPPEPVGGSAAPLGDMSSLLAVVLGRLAAVRDRTTDPIAARDLVDAEEAAWRVAEAVRRVLGFTPGPDPHAAVPLDLSPLVRDTVRATEALWAGDGGGPGLTLDLEPVPPVRGHPDEIRQALQHFLKNAREASEGESPPIVVRLRWDGATRVELAVVDRGRGMDESTRGRAGEPFFTTKGPGRLGVGLTVAQAVAARHRGELDLESVPGQGTTVRLRLPTAGGSRSGPPRAPRAPRLPARILVVEDERPVRETLVQGLAREDYTVLAAEDVGDAIALIAREAVDIVVTDLVLPGGSGLEVARTVKRSQPRAAVVLVTGWPGRVDSETLERHGIDAIVEKPVGLEALRATVARLVERAAAGPG
jgi:signal transduction histidine kinase